MIDTCVCLYICVFGPLGIPGSVWLRLVGSLKLQVSFAKEPYKRHDILQKSRNTHLLRDTDSPMCMA